MKSGTLLLRQVNSAFLQNGRPTSQVFRPTPKDKEKLSVYDGDMIDATAAYTHFTQKLGFQSSGVLSVTVGECDAFNLSAYPDPEPFPEHAVIDFSNHAKREVERIAKELRGLADQRGWLYRKEFSGQ